MNHILSEPRKAIPPQITTNVKDDIKRLERLHRKVLDESVMTFFEVIHESVHFKEYAAKGVLSRVSCLSRHYRRL